jgi:predicted DNA-binding protein with PD1-like motif
LIHVELGYYHLEHKDYLRKTFSEMDYELISLTGNISLKDGNPYIHVHAALGDNQFRVFGGHLFEAEVAVTAEVSIIPLGKMPVRELDKNIGLATICKIQ